MVNQIIRYIIILLAVFVAASYLPDLYWLSVSEPIRYPFVVYSPISETFVIGEIEDREFKWHDPVGNYFELDEVDSLLPFFNYRQLAAKGKLPDSVKGLSIDVDNIRLNNFRQRIRPSSIEAPQIGLYPLFESNPPRLELEMPLTYFRISDRMEFIDAETNTIVDSLSNSFTDALEKIDFTFPARIIAGNPTTRKPFDEGYFIVDAEGQMYHVKMVNGMPVVRNTHIPDNIKVREIFVSESNLREFYGLLISMDNNIYLIMYDGYRLQRLPVDQYNAFHDILMFQGNLMYRIISITSENMMTTYVTNRDYELIATHEESWEGRSDRLSGEIEKYLFPFSLSLQSRDRPYIDFYFGPYHVSALFLSIILTGIFLVLRRKNENKINKLIDTLIILVSGIFGFLAVLLIPDISKR